MLLSSSSAVLHIFECVDASCYFWPSLFRASFLATPLAKWVNIQFTCNSLIDAFPYHFINIICLELFPSSYAARIDNHWFMRYCLEYRWKLGHGGKFFHIYDLLFAHFDILTKFYNMGGVYQTLWLPCLLNVLYADVALSF